MVRGISRIIYRVLLCTTFTFIYATIYAQNKLAIRYEIDAKRAGVSLTSKDALPRGREFKRLDSTYYVGWLLEGSYKYEHAADFVGYKVAATQLDKALQLLEKDFKKELKTRTSDVMIFLQNMKFHRDWDYTAYALMQCYSNMEDPENVWRVLQKCKKMDLQDEQYLDTYNYLGWTIHRNRFYTSKKYSFLKNSIDDNEKYANLLLDSAALKIKRDAALFKSFLSINYEKEKMPAVWHYKSILYTYQLNMESGAYYYDKLKSTPYFPANNFATFCAIQAKFREAENYYNLSNENDNGDKRLNESYYYLSIIRQYKNENKKGIEELKSLLRANGSTPGFGWYNIALARNFIYDGQLEAAKNCIQKSAAFKEIHIGTTLGQSHYDFSNALMQLVLITNEISWYTFTNKDWWYSPNDIQKIARLTIDKIGLQFLIINQFADNPERDRVIYTLFSTESTVSVDEIWYLIEGFSTNYFLERFSTSMSTEKRYNVKRYYKYFVAKLLIKKKQYAKAIGYLESIQRDLVIDADYEKLLIARTLEAIIYCKQQLDEYVSPNDLQKLYQNYPQLIPFSALRIPMSLQHNARTQNEMDIINQLKNSAISFYPNKDGNYPLVQLQFQPGKTSLVCSVTLQGKKLIAPITIQVQPAKKTKEEVMKAIFQIGKEGAIQKEKISK